MNALLVTTGAVVLGLLLLGWRRDHRQRVKSEALMLRTIGERFDREWIPLKVVRAWESWN